MNFNNAFWKKQIFPTLVPGATLIPNQVEWPTDYYPLRSASDHDAAHITDFLEYLTPKFTTIYQGPNCVITLNTSRTPYRELASCIVSDQADDSLWTVTDHP